MKAIDIYIKETGNKIPDNVREYDEWLIDYHNWLEKFLEDNYTPSEKFICPCCGSNKTYITRAFHCSHCAVTTEI